VNSGNPTDGSGADGAADLDAGDLEDAVGLEDVAGPADVDMVEPDEAELDVEAALEGVDLDDLGDLEPAEAGEAAADVDLEDDEGADTVTEGALAEAGATPGLTAASAEPLPVPGGEAVRPGSTSPPGRRRGRGGGVRLRR